MRSKQTNPTDVILRECKLAMRGGSKSFSLAASVFGREMRDAAYLLYGWCRYCDDQIDKLQSKELILLNEKLSDLRRSTFAAYKDEPLGDPVFRALQLVVKKYEIPPHYPVELLEGLAMDIRNQTYPTLKDLELYCYRVAGTVGLMMSHIMGISDHRALEHACHMGIAMQLTNIARDVLEDAAMGRIYLPLEWLAEEAVPQDEIGELRYRPRLAKVVKKLLRKAENYYQSGDRGLRYLNLRAAMTIATARHIYSQIGVQVVGRDKNAWDKRVYVSLPRKIALAIKAVAQEILTLPRRFVSSWEPISISRVWRHA